MDMEDEGVEQLQLTALDSVDTTTTGEAEQEDEVLWYMCYSNITTYPHTRAIPG